MREKICRSCGRLVSTDQFSPAQTSCQTCQGKWAHETYQEGHQRKSDNPQQDSHQTGVSSQEKFEEPCVPELLQIVYVVVRNGCEHILRRYNQLYESHERLKKLLATYGERIE